MTLIDTDVVQHGSLFEKLYIDRQFAVFAGNFQTTVSHLSGVFKQYPAELIVRRVVFIDYRLIVHNELSIIINNELSIHSSQQRSIHPRLSPLRTLAPCLAATSTSLPPSAAGIGTISPHGA